MTVPCRYCGAQVASYALAGHKRRCPRNPKVARRVRTLLQRHARVGVICSTDTYQLVTLDDDAYPGLSLLIGTIGDWDAVARWADLRPLEEFTHAQWDVFVEEIRRLSKELHEGRYAPSRGEFDTWRDPELFISLYFVRRYGHWRDIMAELGLPIASDLHYRQAAMKRSKTGSRRVQRQLRRKMLISEMEEAEQREPGLAADEPTVRRCYDDRSKRWVLREVVPLT